jgi:hypothetical protein
VSNGDVFSVFGSAHCEGEKTKAKMRFSFAANF